MRARVHFIHHRARISVRQCGERIDGRERLFVGLLGRPQRADGRQNKGAERPFASRARRARANKQRISLRSARARANISPPARKRAGGANEFGGEFI